MAAMLKLMPLMVAKFLISSGLLKFVSFFYKMAPRTLSDVVNELTDNKDLRAVFTYIFGTYGTDGRTARRPVNPSSACSSQFPSSHSDLQETYPKMPAFPCTA